MAWPAIRGVEVGVRHAVRDLAGALVSGQAAGLTAALSDGAGAASVLPVVATEIGTSGWYRLAFTPDAAGAWILTVTNPAAPTSDGQDVEYAVAVAEAGIPGAPLAGYGLTDLATVHDFLKLADSETKWDALLELLIDGITSDLELRAGRHFGQYSYVEDLDGLGGDTLWLRQAPAVSVASVASLAYSSAGVTATALDPAAYVLRLVPHGAGGEDDRAGLLRVDSGLWTPGRLNWRVTYTAGYAVLPPGLTLDATRLVVAHFRRADLEGLVSSGALDLSTTPLDPTELDRLADRVANKWRVRLGAL